MKLTLEMPRRTPPQIRADQCKTRFLLSIWGRQSGKTTRGYRKLLWKPLQSREGGVWWHVLQTYSAADVVFERYLRFLHPHRDYLLKYKNEVERRVELPGNRNVFFKSGHNFEDLRTETLDGVIIDEARQQRPELWRTVIFPMLIKFNAWGELATTPNGYDWIYDLKREKETDPSWTTVVAPSSEAWWWTPEQIAEAKKNMSDLEFRQEIGAEFVNLRAGKVYYSFTDANKTPICPWYAAKPWSPYHPVILGLDFNITPMHWTLGQVVNHYYWFFDEIHLNESNTFEASRELAGKLLQMREQGHRPPDYDVILCGDASGNARSTKGNGSDYEIIKQVLKASGLRFKDVTPAANPAIKDRVNAVNAKCRAANGQVALWVHPTQCKFLIHDFERLTWKSGSDFILDPGPQKDLSHATDSIGYVVSHFSPVKEKYSAKQSVLPPRI